LRVKTIGETLETSRRREQTSLAGTVQKVERLARVRPAAVTDRARRRRNGHKAKEKAMSSRSSLILDLARIMIKQAKLLKSQGLLAEAREFARRAVELNHAGHASQRLQPVPVRVKRRR
jgi:hypothetical protein